jgi:hypothetical protein
MRPWQATGINPFLLATKTQDNVMGHTAQYSVNAHSKHFTIIPGANPMIASYNAFRIKIIFLRGKTLYVCIRLC